MKAGRFEQRIGAQTDLENEFLKKHGKRGTEAHQAVYKKVPKLINSPHVKARNLSDDAMAESNAYGMNQFADGYLMARQLVEASTKFIEVSLDGWDAHDDNLILVIDLADRNLLD